MPLARITLAAAAAALLMGGAAIAQPAMQDNNANPPASDQSMPAQSAPMPVGQSGTTTNDQAAQPMAPADSGMTATTATGSNVDATAPAGVQVIASAPVPDTPANRAKYGKPMSNAGKRTAATGD